MEDLIIVRRKRGTKGQWLSHEKPCIKLELPRGAFTIFEKTAKLLNAANRDALMFAFSKVNKCGYVFKEDPQEDSYYLSNTGRAYYRFTSKELATYFIDIFEIKPDEIGRASCRERV